MNRKWGGACPIMHPTLISEAACLGPYPKTLVIGDTQSMTFGEDDNGPFYLPEAKWQEEKHDRPSGKMKAHHCTGDQESAFIAKIWRESQKSGE